MLTRYYCLLTRFPITNSVLYHAGGRKNAFYFTVFSYDHVEADRTRLVMTAKRSLVRRLSAVV